MEPLKGQRTGTPIPESFSTKLQRIAHLAREAAQRALLSLAHYIDLEFLREAFRRTRKDAATGVDGQSGADYAEHLEENLQGLLDRFKSGRYHAPPVRRAYVPKGDGSATRPIGVPTFEDKVLQRAVAMGCWKRCMSKTFWRARTAFGPGARCCRRCRRSVAGAQADGWGLGRGGGHPAVL